MQMMRLSNLRTRRNGKGSTRFLWFTFITHAPWSWWRCPVGMRPWRVVAKQRSWSLRNALARVVQHGSSITRPKTKSIWRAEVYSRNIVWLGEAMIVSHLPSYTQTPISSIPLLSNGGSITTCLLHLRLAPVHAETGYRVTPAMHIINTKADDRTFLLSSYILARLRSLGPVMSNKTDPAISSPFTQFLFYFLAHNKSAAYNFA
jgi:hypothetical protein